MGLSAFNAMRARQKKETSILEKTSSIEVKVNEPESEKIQVTEEKVDSVSEEKVENSDLLSESKPKKTDAEKLKKKKE